MSIGPSTPCSSSGEVEPPERDGRWRGVPPSGGLPTEPTPSWRGQAERRAGLAPPITGSRGGPGCERRALQGRDAAEDRGPRTKGLGSLRPPWSRSARRVDARGAAGPNPRRSPRVGQCRAPPAGKAPARHVGRGSGGHPPVKGRPLATRGTLGKATLYPGAQGRGSPGCGSLACHAPGKRPLVARFLAVIVG